MTRNFWLIVIASIILGAPMPMLILLGALAGQSLAPTATLATLPPSIQMLAGIIVAIPFSVYMGKAGRRNGFLLGAAILIAGGLCAAVALTIKSFFLLCVAHLILGTALIGLNFFRFAAAESVSDQHKAKAISFLLASGLIAALFGPLIYTHFKDALLPAPFAGGYVALAVIAAVGCIPLAFMDKLLPSTPQASAKSAPEISKREILARPVVLLAMGTAAISQAAMVILMVPTPLAMEYVGHAGHHSADVIRWHVIAMFAPGFFTGYLITRFGVMRIISIGFVVLLCAGIVALQGTGLVHFYVSLILLGIGWNFGFIGGTYLLQSAIAANERPVIQGVNDTLLAIASSLASFSAGVLYAGFGWDTLAGATLVALLIAIVAVYLTSRSASSA